MIEKCRGGAHLKISKSENYKNLTGELVCTAINPACNCIESTLKIGKDVFHINSYFGNENLSDILHILALERMAKGLEVSADLCYDGCGEKEPLFNA